MSLEFLAGIVNARFPLTVRHPVEVDKVRLLKAAELITASVPPDWRNAGLPSDSAAVVFGVTERGETAARQACPPPEGPLRRGRHLFDDE